VGDIEQACGFSDRAVLRGNPRGVLDRHLEASEGNDLSVGGDVVAMQRRALEGGSHPMSPNKIAF
jgi:hypothetical protein